MLFDGEWRSEMIKADEMLTNIHGDLKYPANPKLKRGVLIEEVSRSLCAEISIISFERDHVSSLESVPA
jgi:hypothetical protein